MKILPPTLLTLCIGVILVLHCAWPVWQILIFPWNLAGVILIISGLALTSSGSRQFEQVGTTVMTFDAPGRLVVSGLYRYTRNPMYLGFVLLLAGIWMALGSLSPLGVVIFFLAVTDIYYIRFEENMLEKTFGDDFRQYCQQVRRWI